MKILHVCILRIARDHEVSRILWTLRCDLNKTLRGMHIQFDIVSDCLYFAEKVICWTKNKITCTGCQGLLLGRMDGSSSASQKSCQTYSTCSSTAVRWSGVTTPTESFVIENEPRNSRHNFWILLPTIKFAWALTCLPSCCKARWPPRHFKSCKFLHRTNKEMALSLSIVCKSAYGWLMLDDDYFCPIFPRLNFAQGDGFCSYYMEKTLFSYLVPHHRPFLAGQLQWAMWLPANAIQMCAPELNRPVSAFVCDFILCPCLTQ